MFVSNICPELQKKFRVMRDYIPNESSSGSAYLWDWRGRRMAEPSSKRVELDQVSKLRHVGTPLLRRRQTF